MTGPGRYIFHALCALLLAFLILPVMVILPASFNNASYIQFPPELWSLRWYEDFLHDTQWMRSLGISLQISIASTACALIVGTLAAIGLERSTGWLRSALNGLFLAPIVVPYVVTGMALYYFGRRTGLSGSYLLVVLGHTLVTFPYVLINVAVSLRGVDPNLARAAAGLGASPTRIFYTVSLPAIAPGLIGGGIFAFILSFDELIVTIFVAGVGTKTFPMKMWEILRTEFTPVTTVASVVMMTFTLLLIPAILAFERRRGTFGSAQ